MDANTCLIERSDVRAILIEAAEINNDATTSILADVDALPIVTLAEKDAEIERLRAELTAARDALYNGFEPDNQSRAWHRANAALEQIGDGK
jgi:hypothetical protein